MYHWTVCKLNVYELKIVCNDSLVLAFFHGNRVLLLLFIPRHTIVAGCYGFTLVVRESVHPSIVCPSVRFLFPDDNLSKHQGIFSEIGMCIDIVEIWFGIANGQILSIFDGVICPRHAHIFVSGL